MIAIDALPNSSGVLDDDQFPAIAAHLLYLAQPSIKSEVVSACSCTATSETNALERGSPVEPSNGSLPQFPPRSPHSRSLFSAAPPTLRPPHPSRARCCPAVAVLRPTDAVRGGVSPERPSCRPRRASDRRAGTPAQVTRGGRDVPAQSHDHSVSGRYRHDRPPSLHGLFDNMIGAWTTRLHAREYVGTRCAGGRWRRR